jgi:hypothetical protein
MKQNQRRRQPGFSLFRPELEIRPKLRLIVEGN